MLEGARARPELPASVSVFAFSLTLKRRLLIAFKLKLLRLRLNLLWINYLEYLLYLGLFLDRRVGILEKFGESPLQFTHYIRLFRIGPLKIFVWQPRTKFSFWQIRFLNLLCILLLLTFLVRIFYLLFFGVLIAALYLTGPVDILHLLLLEIRIWPKLTAYIHDPRRLILSSTGHLFTILRGGISRWGLRRGFGDIPRSSC